MAADLYGAILAVLVGVTAAVRAAGWFVESSATLADDLRMPHAAFGATVVALVAFLPENAVAVGAARMGRLDLAVGHAFSSASTNLCLAMAAAGFASGLKGFGRQAAGHMLVVAASGAAAWILASGEGLTRLRAALLFPVFGLAMIYWLRSGSWTRPIKRGADSPRVHDAPDSRPLQFGFAISLVAFGAWALARAVGPAMVSPGTGFASPVMIAAAIGSALPEAAVAVAAGLRSAPGLALGVVSGASVLNLTAVIGTAGLIAPGSPAPAAWGIQAPLVTGIALVLALFFRIRGGIRRAEAATLVVLYLAYLGAMLR